MGSNFWIAASRMWKSRRSRSTGSSMWSSSWSSCEEFLDVLGGAPLHRGDEDVLLRPEVTVEAAGSRRETDGTLDVADRRPVEAPLEEQLE